MDVTLHNTVQSKWAFQTVTAIYSTKIDGGIANRDLVAAVPAPYHALFAAWP